MDRLDFGVDAVQNVIRVTARREDVPDLDEPNLHRVEFVAERLRQYALRHASPFLTHSAEPVMGTDPAHPRANLEKREPASPTRSMHGV
jgi:hypothetical protein